MKKIGILGGTFDPPHYGHLLVAQEVLTALQLNEIWFIPTNIPPHKERSTTPAADRLRMLELTIENEENFHVNPIELTRSGPSYSVDTMHILKEMHPSSSFYFVIGGDMVESLHTWDRIDDLIELVTFVGVKRPGFSFQSKYPIIEVEIPIFGVSSSLIRQRCREGKNIKYLVKENVNRYIKENNLYE